MSIHVPVALNHEEIGKQLERMSKIKPLIDKYNWKDINYPSGRKRLVKILKKNNPTVLNVLNAKKRRKNKSCLYFKTQLKA